MFEGLLRLLIVFSSSRAQTVYHLCARFYDKRMPLKSQARWCDMRDATCEMGFSSRYALRVCPTGVSHRQALFATDAARENACFKAPLIKVGRFMPNRSVVQLQKHSIHRLPGRASTRIRTVGLQLESIQERKMDELFHDSTSVCEFLSPL